MGHKGKYSKLIYFYTHLYRRGYCKIATLFEKANHLIFGAQISKTVKIGDNVYFPHYGLGVEIAPNTVIGDNCIIYQNCKIGSEHKESVVEDNVLIGAGAVIGPGQHIGAYSNVGANSVVNFDVTPHSTIVGNPGRVIKRG